MSYPATVPVAAPTLGYGLLMPMPGPLGRLVRRRRFDLGIKSQQVLSDMTEALGCRVPQNTISRLESGKTQRMNNIAYLDALGKALQYTSSREFIVAAYGAKGMAAEDEGAEAPDQELLVRVLRASHDLSDEQTERLRHFVRHVRDAGRAGRGPSPEERIAAYARELARQPSNYRVSRN